MEDIYAKQNTLWTAENKPKKTKAKIKSASEKRQKVTIRKRGQSHSITWPGTVDCERDLQSEASKDNRDVTF